MRLQDGPFRLFAQGKKRVEVRLLDEKRRAIRPGDTLILRHVSSDEYLVRYVVRLHRYPDFKALFAALPPEAMGEGLTAEDLYAYYSPEDEKKWGALGIELCADPDVKKYMTEAEAWDYVSRCVLEKYADAFQELAKGPDWD